MKDLNKDTEIMLDNGVEIPQIGFGTYKTRPNEARQAIETALDAGYTHIDTAAVYGNEAEIGETINDSDIDRDNLFITTKVWNVDQGYDSTLKAFEDSLNRLKTDYVDLYLIHWPVKSLRKDTWKALIKIYEDGLARSIGVSNYTIQHLEELIKESSINPVINQVEMSPFLYQKKLTDYCDSHNIKIEAYSPLTRTHKFGNKILVDLSEKYNKSQAQILIRWSLQKGYIVLPKSSTPERIRENIDVYNFNISDDDMQKLDSLDENYRVAWNPEEID